MSPSKMVELISRQILPAKNHLALSSYLRVEVRLLDLFGQIWVRLTLDPKSRPVTFFELIFTCEHGEKLDARIS